MIWSQAVKNELNNLKISSNSQLNPKKCIFTLTKVTIISEKPQNNILIPLKGNRSMNIFDEINDKVKETDLKNDKEGIVIMIED